jgi:hypothetical protein
LTTPQTPDWYDQALEETACLTSVVGPEAQGREAGAATAWALDIAQAGVVAKLGGIEVRWGTFPLRVELGGDLPTPQAPPQANGNPASNTPPKPQ